MLSLYQAEHCKVLEQAVSMVAAIIEEELQSVTPASRVPETAAAAAAAAVAARATMKSSSAPGPFSLFETLADATLNASKPQATSIDFAAVALERARIEMATYMSLDPIPHTAAVAGDALGFYALREGLFPGVAKLARMLLNLAGSSAMSERTFSATGKVLTHDRNQLGEDVAGDTIFLHG